MTEQPKGSKAEVYLGDAIALIRQHESAVVDEALWDNLFYTADYALPYIDRHPYGKPVANKIRKCLQEIVAAKLQLQAPANTAQPTTIEVLENVALRLQVTHPAAMSEEQAVERWQPIETAPKDGPKILGYSPYWDVGTIRWQKSQSGISGFWDVSTRFAHSNAITHWMLLPKPPAEQPKGSEGEPDAL